MSEQREQSRRAANNLFSDRKDPVAASKAEAQAKSAASDANTARLRALRLNKEKAEAQAKSAKIRTTAGAAINDAKANEARRNRANPAPG